MRTIIQTCGTGAYAQCQAGLVSITEYKTIHFLCILVKTARSINHSGPIGVISDAIIVKLEIPYTGTLLKKSYRLTPI